MPHGRTGTKLLSCQGPPRRTGTKLLSYQGSPRRTGTKLFSYQGGHTGTGEPQGYTGYRAHGQGPRRDRDRKGCHTRLTTRREGKKAFQPGRRLRHCSRGGEESGFAAGVNDGGGTAGGGYGWHQHGGRTALQSEAETEGGERLCGRGDVSVGEAVQPGRPFGRNW